VKADDANAEAAIKENAEPR